MSTAQEKRKKSRLRIRDKYTQIANLKKLNDRRETDSGGRKKKLKTGGANIPSKGQRKLVLQAGGHGMGSDYKKSEEKAFKKAKDWQKSVEKKKITEKRKANSKTGSGSTTTTSTTKKGGKMHAIEKANRKRFGDAHVDKLKARYAAFKAKRKKKK